MDRCWIIRDVYVDVDYTPADDGAVAVSVEGRCVGRVLDGETRRVEALKLARRALAPTIPGADAWPEPCAPGTVYDPA